MVFWSWVLAVEVLGLIFMPLTGRLFHNFKDRGWMFSKVLGIFVTGFLNWWLVSVKLISFSDRNCFLICGLAAMVSIGLVLLEIKSGKDSSDFQAWFPYRHVHLILGEECIFLLVFLMWTYFSGFNPQAYGTEKFMDYGFMEAMMRSPVLPPRDLWYSEGHINYYYGGQYFAVFLTKISGNEVRHTYNLMRDFVAALAFVLPFSLVYQMSMDRMQKLGDRERISALAGLTAGTAVSIAGNMHYVVYRVGLSLYEMITRVDPMERSGYWFPDATRYIGFRPDVPDKTIHEFPSYSFVLGDLHAHVVNIIFVLLVLGLLYSWMKGKRTQEDLGERDLSFYLHELTMPHILLVSLLLGMFQWTNFWDFVIYYVVCGGTVVFANTICFRGKFKTILTVTALQAVEVMVIGYLAILPFTLQFDSMVDGVALAQNHSLPHQLLVLWGLPTILSLIFFLSLFTEKIWKKKRKLYQVMKSISIPDLYAVIMALCAMGLVMIPELVYVRDIYENGNARANTMFKLTYQAYIMFGITMGFVIWRLLIVSRKLIFQLAGTLGIFCLLLTCGYFGNSVHSWFGEVWSPEFYKGLDATAYFSYTFPDDAAAIQWLKDNVEGVPVVLEANGDSYTDYDRVSAMTGLPTILGWYVHEWLWRNNTDDLNFKSADIQSIYTSDDEQYVRELLRRYGVSYIFLGAKEVEKYGEGLDEDFIKSLGTVVFQDEYSGTSIVCVE